MSPFIVAALYQFAKLPDCHDLRPAVLAFCEAHALKGTILLAAEGINGTVAGSRTDIDALLAVLRADARLGALEHKESVTDEMPFYRMKVRLKKEIVTLGVPGIDPNEKVGTYVAPEDWNALISDPEVLVVDTRNDYEFDIGTFRGAVDPQTATFRDFPAYVRDNLDPKKHKKIALFCTGGIRCEKATTFMLEQGFEHVYHLKGGILKYLEKVPVEQSLWEGECFVFDQRVAVGHGLKLGEHEQCRSCRHPISPEDRTSPKYQTGVSCPRCFDTLSDEKRARAVERQKQVDLALQRGTSHIGVRHQKR